MLDIIKSFLNEEMSREEKTHLVREQLQVLLQNSTLVFLEDMWKEGTFTIWSGI